MKASHRACIIVGALVVLGGCASTPTASNSKLLEDQSYIARVEQIDKDRGIAVRWVNPPQKRQNPNKDL
jgi:hypothetical protein